MLPCILFNVLCFIFPVRNYKSFQDRDHVLRRSMWYVLLIVFIGTFLLNEDLLLKTMFGYCYGFSDWVKHEVWL